MIKILIKKIIILKNMNKRKIEYYGENNLNINKKNIKIFVVYQKNYQNDKNLDLLNSENVYNEIAKRGKY